jgi:tetratricopeptide (TPR) repeat protein
MGAPAAFFASGVVLRREAARTARQAEKASTINRFLLDTLGAAHPAELGYDGTIREAVALAVERAGENFGEPEVEAGVRATIGNTFVAVGDFDGALPELRRALELSRDLFPPGHPELGRSLLDLARCRRSQGDLEEARALLAESLASSTGGAEAERLRADALGELGLLESELGDFAGARQHVRSSLELASELYGAASAEVAEGWIDLGTVLEREARARGNDALDEAQATYQRALDQLSSLRGADHPDTAACRGRLADLLLERRDLDGALRLYRENLESFLARLGERHPLVARTRASLALTEFFARRVDAALLGAEEALALQREILPAGHPDLARSAVVVARILMDLNRPEEASRLLEEAVAIRRARHGSHAVATADALHQLARAYFEQVRMEEALEAGNEALAIYAEHPDIQPELVGGLEHVVGRAWIVMGRNDLARERLEHAVSVYDAQRGPAFPSTLLYMQDLAGLYAIERRWEQAAALAQRIVDARLANGGLNDREGVVTFTYLAEASAKLGRREAALAAARAAIDASAPGEAGMTIQRISCELLVGRLLFEEGRLEEALEPLLQSVGIALQHGVQVRAALDCARLYGEALVSLGRYDEAEPRLQETFLAQAAYLGVQHADSLATLACLERLHLILGQSEELSFVRGMRDLAAKLRDSGLAAAVDDGQPHFSESD